MIYSLTNETLPDLLGKIRLPSVGYANARLKYYIFLNDFEQCCKI
jgi:hypothetical protein